MPISSEDYASIPTRKMRVMDLMRSKMQKKTLFSNIKT